MISYVVSCLFFLSVICDVLADRTSLKIYENIQGDIFCFRRLNATHQIGCASDRNGNIGVVHVVENYKDVEHLAENAPYAQYVVALPIALFNMGNMTHLKQSKGISGVLIIKGQDQQAPSSFSPEQSCPNRNFGLYTDKVNEKYAGCPEIEWNEHDGNLALGMMYQDWGMPIFLITNETSIKYIHQCYKNFNEPRNGTVREWPLCSAQLKSVMLAAKDSDTCMRRSRLVTNLNEVKTCDPLSDKNIITTLFPTNKSEDIENRSVIVVGARLDAFSLFDRIAPGAHSTVTGLITLLTVANTMAELQNEVKEQMGENKNNILFIIFNGEAFDYIGSSRVVFDMQKGVFPVKPDDNVKMQPAPLYLHHISHFIELSQLAPPLSNSTFWVHTDPVSTTNETVKDLVKEMFNNLMKEAKNIKLRVNLTHEDYPLPPASFQSFLRYDNNIPGIVIADHETKFMNRYYNSMFDTNDTLNSSALTKGLTDLASSISRMLCNYLTKGNCSLEISANRTLVVGLLECYLKNASCNLFREIADPAMTERLRVEPYPLYVSVDSGGHTKANAITLYTRYLLAYLTGSTLDNRTRENCSHEAHDQIYQYDWMAGPDNSSGICLKSTVMYTLAQSPAYELADWKSRDFSTWTESVWLETSVRIFLQPSKAQEAVTLITGILIFFLSITAVYFINSRASIIFNAKPLIGC